MVDESSQGSAFSWSVGFGPSGPVAGLLVGMLLLVTLGCGGASLRGTEVRDLGRGTQRDITLAVQEEMAKHGYLLTTYTETTSRMYWETSWLVREPFDDEIERGVERVRTRMTVQAQRGASGFFLVTLRAENYATGITPGSQWSPMPSTEMFLDHLRALSSSIQLRIDVGIRTRGPEPPCHGFEPGSCRASSVGHEKHRLRPYVVGTS